MQRHPTERRRYAEMLLRSEPGGASPVVCVSRWAQGSLKVRIETLARRRLPMAQIDLATQVVMVVWIAAFAVGWALQTPTRPPPGWAGFFYPL